MIAVVASADRNEKRSLTGGDARSAGSATTDDSSSATNEVELTSKRFTNLPLLSSAHADSHNTKAGF